MNRKISILTFVLSLVLVALVVFMTTYTVLSDAFRVELAKAYEEQTLSGDETVPEEENQSVAEEQFYTEKLGVIKRLFEFYSYFDLEE